MRRPLETSIFPLLFVVYFFNDVNCQMNVNNRILPSCILGANTVDYYFFNRDIPDGVVIQFNVTNIPVNVSLGTVFIVHGFISEANITEYYNLTEVLIRKYNLNVFSVDWKQGACSDGITLAEILSYPAAISNTRVVGKYLATFIGRLITDFGAKLESMMLIGHSLGAHIVGFAGKQVQKRKIGILPNIIGLDPAGPGFELNACRNRICKSDATFVQIFHTSFAAGIHREVGNDDFYFNGGSSQPDCPLLTRPACSHSSAIAYLTFTLAEPNCKFIGKKWQRLFLFPPTSQCTEDTCSIPGISATDFPARGTFYVDTQSVPSFCHLEAYVKNVL